MYVPAEHLFVFRLQRDGDRVVQQGLSPRYTAITLLGLAGESAEVQRSVLHGHEPLEVCGQLVKSVLAGSNVGDAAVTLWAASILGFQGTSALREHMIELQALDRPCPSVELSWVLMASCVDPALVELGYASRAANRLLEGFNATTGVFPHVTGDNGSGLRGHVSCFADFVYPIQSLAAYHSRFNEPQALAAAVRCAEQACRTQGSEGQWWWHFDRRTGQVLERYPVYTVHQHGMGPMALFELQEAGGPSYQDAISRSLEWQLFSPEIGASTIDAQFNLIWRKVARREPKKLARKMQAAVSYLHPSLRVPALDLLMPAGSVDYECRPYELGWLLYAWPDSRARGWSVPGLETCLIAAAQMSIATERINRAETVFRRIVWGAQEVGFPRTIAGLVRYGLLSLRAPEYGEVVTNSAHLRISFRYPEQLMPLMVVFRDLLDPELGILPQLLGPGKVAMDVGASIGTWTLPAARTGARVFAFEPEPDNVSTLRENLRLNGLGANVVIQASALGSDDGWSSVSRADRRYLSNVRLATESEESSQTRVQSLDHVIDCLELPRVDILKINTAGCESDVISGARESFRDERIGLALVLDGLAVRPLLEEFRDYSYVLGFYDGRKRQWVTVRESREFDALRPGPLNRYIIVKHASAVL